MRLDIVLWICDLCLVEVENGRPAGWTWFRRAMNGHVGHRCADCTKKTSPEHQGLPLGVESATQHFARK